MTLELRPSGVACNLRCEYCYQNPVRDKHDAVILNNAQIKDLLNQAERELTLFGGESLVTPIETLEKIWEYNHDKFGRSSIQTNGTLITDKHVELMKKYEVHVGVSIDGDEDMNDLRWAGTLKKTREMTAKTIENIEKLIKNNVNVSMIITLHKLNASSEKREQFKTWLRKMDEIGVGSCRFHLLEKEGIGGDEYALSNEDYLEALIEFSQLNKKLNMKIDKYKDVIKLVQGKDNCVTCTWSGCDPWYTSSVETLDYDGRRGCGRPHKDGREWIKASTKTYERTVMLYETPQEDGGCKDCPYFIMCKGQCAGTGIDGDWRNRSEYCEVFKGLFEYYGEKLKELDLEPIYERADLKKIEEIMIKYFKRNEHITIQRAIHELQNETNNSCDTGNKTRLVHDDKAHHHLDSGRSHIDRPHTDHLDKNKRRHEDSRQFKHIDHLDTHQRPHEDKTRHLDHTNNS